ncbi:MAG: LacI family DNA-binding transcriptional regulator [Puniceicoccales bacterium]
MATLKDIATDLNVSQALVSRVLSNRMGTSRVSEKTRIAILEKAKELDFTPNPNAIALRKGIKGVVAVFLHGIGTEGSDIDRRFLQAIGKKLSENSCNMMLEFFEHKTEFIQACNPSLLNKVDGLIVAGFPHQELIENLVSLEKEGLPVVSAFQAEKKTTPGICNFTVDYVKQTYITTAHLLGIGCTRIAHFRTVKDRYDGYQLAHEHFDTPLDPALCIYTPTFSHSAGYQAMEHLLESGLEFDAICAQSDGQALGAIQKLALSGVPRSKWPKMTGVDNSPIAKYYSLVPLTSSTVEMKQTGELSVDAILKKIKGEPVEGKIVAPRLIIRESTQPSLNEG